MNNQFSKEVSSILLYSREEASRTSCARVSPEHLLLAMLRLPQCVLHELLHHYSVDEKLVRKDIDAVVSHRDDATAGGNGLQLDESATNILMLSVLEARKLHSPIIDTSHILLAILHDRVDNTAKQILNKFSMNYDDTLQLLSAMAGTTQNGLGVPDEDELEPEEESKAPSATSTKTSNPQKAKEKSKTPILDNFSFDLTQAAGEHRLDPVIGRERQIQRLTEILCRRKKNNPVIIGEAGVGKSAIVEGLAQLIARQETSPLLFNKRLVSLDLTAVVAGTKYRGQFEERIKALVKELEQNPDIIIFIDEIHTMIGAGSAPGSMDAANILKPALARGTIQCIGATTLDEYRNSIEKDGALERRFQKVMVEPTTPEETLHILQNIKQHYSDFHHVTYSDAALKACIDLSARYVTDRVFPDKAIDALDETGARVRLQHAKFPEGIKELQQQLDEVKQKKINAVQSQDFELAAAYRDEQQSVEHHIEQLNQQWMEGNDSAPTLVSENDVAHVIATMTGVPVQRLEESETARLRHMADKLKQQVIAQDAAIDRISKAIQRNRLGLREPNHPIGVFMFLGPTGVGKTHLAKKLAEQLFGTADDLIRIDMSEYTESFNVSRLIGSPPGYVGYEEGGQLTERVRRKPYSIVLLDEIEKAHPNVYNLLLQVLDEGRLTDGNGRVVDFRNTIVILTSNAGTRQLKEFGRGIGFTTANTSFTHLSDTDKAYARQIVQKALSKQFAPEFLNRLDDIIIFDQLDQQAIGRIVDIELAQLTTRLRKLGIMLTVSDNARQLVASKGYDVQFGARPLKRAIQQYIEDRVCEFMLDHPKTTDEIAITVDKCEDKEDLFVSPTDQPAEA